MDTSYVLLVRQAPKLSGSIFFRKVKICLTSHKLKRLVGFTALNINRMYYACFYAVGALLLKNNIAVSSHPGVRQKFGEHFVKTGIIDRDLAKHFTELFEKRHKGDYNDFFDFDEDTVLKLYPYSKELVERIEQILDG